MALNDPVDALGDGMRWPPLMNAAATMLRGGRSRSSDAPGVPAVTCLPSAQVICCTSILGVRNCGNVMYLTSRLSVIDPSNSDL